MRRIAGAGTGVALGALAIVGLGAGCTAARLATPPDVEAKSELLEAKDRSWFRGLFADESFELGPYAVTAVDRDWNRSSGSAIRFAGLSYSTREIRTGYAFRFEEGAEALEAQCVSLTSREGLARGSSELGSEETRLACTCGTGASAATLELDGRRRKLTGRVTLARGEAEVTSLHEIRDATFDLSEPAGFRVDGAEGPLAAVEVLHPGRLWLSRDLAAEERRQLGCLLAGLMLYAEPAED